MNYRPAITIKEILEKKYGCKQKIIPNLWFDNQAEQAAKFYTSIFENSKVGRITYYGKDGHEIHEQKEGTVMTVEFQIEGQKFVALNGGPQFKFSEAISFIVNCENQEEEDHYWEKLSEAEIQVHSSAVG